MGRGVRIPIRLDKSQAETDAKDLGATLKKSMLEAGASAYGAATALRLVKRAVSEVYDFAKESFSLARAEREAQQLLGLALKHRGDATGELTASIITMNHELEHKQGLDATELANLQRSVLLHGVHKESLAGATIAARGLSTITGGSLSESGVKIAKILEGNIKFLGKLGIEAKNTGEALDKLAEIARTDAKDKLETFDGKLQLLSAHWAELRKDMFGFTGDPKKTFAYRTIEALDQAVLRLQRDMRDPKAGIRDYLATVAAGTVGAAASLVPGLSAFAPKLAQSTFGGLAAPAPRELVRTSEDDKGEREALEAAKREAKKAEDAKNKKEKDKALLAAKKKQDEELVAHEKQWIAQMKELHDQRVNLENEEIDAHARWRRSMADLDTQALIAQREYVDQQNDLNISWKDKVNYGFESQDKLRQAEIKSTEAFWGGMIAIGAQGVGNFVGQMTAGLLMGEKTAGQAARALLGTVVGSVGQAFIALGTAALIAASATEGIPILWPIFGGPIGVGGALALIGAGGILTGFGQAIGSTASGIQQSASSAARSASPGIQSVGPGMDQRMAGGPANQGRAVFNYVSVTIDGSRGMIVGDSQEVARWIADMLGARNGLVLTSG